MLRIYNLISPGIEVWDLDFSLLSQLKKESPSYIKGRKTRATYTHENALYVEKLFTDVMRDGQLVGLRIVINWYNEDHTIGLTKEQLVRNFNPIEAATELRKRRQRALDYLIASAVGTPAEPHIDLLLKRYKVQTDLFVLKHTSDLLHAVNNEPDSTYQGYLNTIVKRNVSGYPHGKRVKDAIIEQIT